MLTIWKILIDWDRNGDFNDPADNITEYVIQANWFLGSRQAYQEMGDNSLLALSLNNEDKRFSPENSSSPLAGKLVPLRSVRIESYNGTTTRVHWQGWIQTIMPTVGRYGERIAQLVASGAVQFLKAAESKITLQENKRTDEIIDTLIQEVIFPPSVYKGAFLNITGFNEVGINAYVVDMDDVRQLEEGSVNMAIAADNWVSDGGFADRPKDTFDVYRGIKDMAATEQGRFFFDREGRAIFWNRQHTLQSYTPAATFDDNMQDLQYTYGALDLLKNDVIVTCHPRSISNSDQDVLWELKGSVIRVPAQTERSLYIKYDDENDNRIGAKDVTVTDIEFATGTATVTVEAKANGAEITVNNTANREAVVEKLIIRGRKIVDKGYLEARAEDLESVGNYGRRTLRINLPSIDNLDDAQSIADFEIYRRAEPRGHIPAITTLSHGRYAGNQHVNQLALTIGDVIRVTETQTGHDKDHIIIGEAHELGGGATFFKTTWYLEPVTEGNWAFVGEAEVQADGHPDLAIVSY